MQVSERHAQVLPARVSVREVGMRDGLQLEPPIDTGSKLRLLEALVATRVRRIQVTSFVSPKAVPALADADAVAAELHRWPGIDWSALVLNSRGARRALDAGIRNVEFVVSAGEGHSHANAGMSTDVALATLADVVEVAKHGEATCELVVATAWDCPFDGPVDRARVLDIVRSALEMGVDHVRLADTIGTVTPIRLLDLLYAVADLMAGRLPGLHLHNTFGAGLANVFAALQAGVDDFDASVGGLGGCPFAPGASGNIATEELLYLLQGCGVDSGLDMEAMLDAVEVAELVLGRTLSSGPSIARRDSASRV